MPYVVIIQDNGEYLAEFDPDMNDGLVSGYVRTTHKLEEALVFASPEEALTLWKTQSTVLPFRPDGEPNRPMTAFSITVQEITKQ